MWSCSRTVIVAFVEDHYDRTDIAADTLAMAHVDLAFVPVPDRLANIDAVVQRGCERLDALAFFGQNAFRLLLQKPAVILNDQILRRIRANRIAVYLLCPFPGILLFLSLLQRARPKSLLDIEVDGGGTASARVLK